MSFRQQAVVVAVLTSAVAGGYWTVRTLSASPARSSSLKTAVARRGDLVVTVAATGTIEPEEVVDVGAQVAGKIQELGRTADGGAIVDYGSIVEPNDVLARIDPALYEEEVRHAEAQLRRARALLEQTKAKTAEALAAEARAKADLVQTQVRLRQAERDYRRAERLAPNNTIPQEEFDAATATFEAAEAAVEIARAAVTQAERATVTSRTGEEEAEANVQSAEATLNRASKNLDYTTIRSPIKGVVIDRRVNVGQTVLASLNAPSLFLIAKDLSRLQVWVSVNEADIGRLRQGQPVTFSVDAFPGETFHGKVTQIRLNASMTQNVVTYTVVVTVDNSQNKLLPYLTANVKFEVARLQDVVTIPNAALRWTPRPELIAPDALPPTDGGAVVWVRAGEMVKPLPVKAGDTDGVVTAVSGEGVGPDLEVVTGELQADAQNVVNPFLPQMRSGKKASP